MRFGNIADSSGILIPAAVKHIREERSIELTNPEMVHYFMANPKSGFV